MSTDADMLAQSLAPRGLSRVQAARYIGVSPGLFDRMVKDGIMPAPRLISSRTVWDRREVDEAFDALPGGVVESNPWDGASSG